MPHTTPEAKQNTLPPPAEAFYARMRGELAALRADGLEKVERVIAGPQGSVVHTRDGRELLNFCANNYLGLSSHPAVIAAAHAALESHGYGLSSVRFICGTQDLHKTLEARLARFLGTEDAILYAAAFDANGGLRAAALVATNGPHVREARRAARAQEGYAHDRCRR